MTASGPFAMGPSAAAPISRNALRSGSNTSAIHASTSSSKLGSDLTQTAPPTLKSEEKNQRTPSLKPEVTVEEYSDPEDGVQIIDMEQVTGMDWMAPDVVKREPQTTKKRWPKRDASMSGDHNKMEECKLDLSCCSKLTSF
jgi:DNA-directed RNA polymerase III subunit RPC4